MVLGGADADTFVFNQTSLVGSTAVYGGLGSDSFVVNQLASMDVADGDTLTLDGQGGADLYTVNTAGSLSTDAHNYVINVLDSGAPNDGVERSRRQRIGRSGRLPAPRHEQPDRVHGPKVRFRPCRRRPHSSRSSTGRSRTCSTARVQDVERINYDSGINGRLIVNGLGGNDIFAVDDNSAITTLDGGAGDDTFLIGQAYYSPRGTANTNCLHERHRNRRRRAPGPPDIDPADAFPTTDTTVGWLSRGNSYPIVAYGGAGNDAFLVLANHAALTLDGGAGNDLFALKASALVNPQTNTVVVDTFLTPTDPDDRCTEREHRAGVHGRRHGRRDRRRRRRRALRHRDRAERLHRPDRHGIAARRRVCI